MVVLRSVISPPREPRTGIPFLQKRVPNMGHETGPAQPPITLKPQEQDRFQPIQPRSPAVLSRGLGVPVGYQKEEKVVLKIVRPVDRDFGILVGALPLEQIEQVASELHNKNNRQSAIINRCLAEIDVYLVDPYRFGSMSLIGRLHSILLEAAQ